MDDNKLFTTELKQEFNAADTEMSIRTILKRAMRSEPFRLGFPTTAEPYPYSLYLNNAGSPFFAGKSYYQEHSKELEKHLIEELAQEFGLEKKQAFGYVTSGGAEANTISIWWLKKYFRAQEKTRIVLLCSEQTHFCIFKACEMMEIPAIKIKADEHKGLDLQNLKQELEKLVQQDQDKKTAIICSINIGTMIEGAIDNICGIKMLLKQTLTPQHLPYLVHADAVTYGILLPLIDKETSHHLFNYVDTFTLSGHKFIGTTGVSGLVIAKRSIIETGFKQRVEEIWAPTLSDARDGNHVIEFYRRLHENFDYFSPGKIKLVEKYKKSLENASYLEKQLAKIAGKGKVRRNILTVTFPRPADKEAQDILGFKYSLMPITATQFNALIFPHVERWLLEQFIRDYREHF